MLTDTKRTYLPDWDATCLSGDPIFLAINGYDEFFEGWGKEDDDLTHRLQRKGCKKRSLRFAGIVYHLWHGHESMESDQKNAEYFRKNNEKKYSLLRKRSK